MIIDAWNASLGVKFKPDGCTSAWEWEIRFIIIENEYTVYTLYLIFGKIQLWISRDFNIL